jgi:isopentenyl-diphosphate delta-isomerase
LILVDESDNKIDSISKVEAHLKDKSNKFPHRAFSVFLFNKNNELLLQKRSLKKITFSDLWSNTCCSHPLDNDEENSGDKISGVKKGAIRRMKFELGIDSKLEDYYTQEKILYRADSDDVFEEYELDYVLLAKLDFGINLIKSRMNKDEVSDVEFVSKNDLIKVADNHQSKITPWFRLILKNKIEEIFFNAQNIEEIKKKGENDIKLTKFTH